MRQIDACLLLEVDCGVKKCHFIVREDELVSLYEGNVINASACVRNGEEVDA